MAQKVEFKYAPMFQVGKDETKYRLLSKEGVTTAEFEGKQIVKVLNTPSERASSSSKPVQIC